MIRPDDCHIIIEAGSGPISLDSPFEPETIIGIEGGEYPSMRVLHQRGPVRIVNLGGVVTITGITDHNIRDNQHLWIDGQNSSDQHGFVFKGRLHVWDSQGQQSHHIELAGLFFDVATSIGLKLTPNKDHILDFVTVKYCKAVTPGGTGFYIGRPHYDDELKDYEMRDVNIHHNEAIDCQSGIELKGCPIRGWIHHNTVRGVLCANIPEDEGGIYFDRGTRGIIEYNIVEDSQGNGIATSGGAIIRHNVIRRCGFSDPVYQDGIKVHGRVALEDVQIHNNRIEDSYRWGINVSNDAVNVRGYNNVILRSGTAPIRHGGSPEANFYDNVFEESPGCSPAAWVKRVRQLSRKV